MQCLARWPLFSQVGCRLGRPSLACLLAQLEDSVWCFIHRAFCPNQSAKVEHLLSSTTTPGGRDARPAPAGPRLYVVDFQLTLAELRFGRVVASYVAPGSRLFETDELNVIWADLTDELGTSPYRLGLEILAIAAWPLPKHYASTPRPTG